MKQSRLIAHSQEIIFLISVVFVAYDVCAVNQALESFSDQTFSDLNFL